MRALVVDDEANIRKVLKMLLTEDSFEINEAPTLSEATKQIENYVFDLALIDLRLPDGSGMDLLRKVKEMNQETVVLVITAFGSAETAIQAMKLGAYDYLTKPFNLDELRVIFGNISEKLSLQKKVRELQQYADAYQLIIGKSEAMKRVFTTVEKIAPFDTGVLIYGETGTGKELVAKALHDKSRRAPKPFVAINCASLPGELLESELFGYARGLSPAPTHRNGASSRTPTAGPSSLMRSPRCLSRCSRSSCASSRTSASVPWAAAPR